MVKMFDEYQFDHDFDDFYDLDPQDDFFVIHLYEGDVYDFEFNEDFDGDVETESFYAENNILDSFDAVLRIEVIYMII
jgi:hypothetical protein